MGKLITGVLVLDFDARDFHSVVYRLVEEFGINDDLSPEMKAEVLRTLLLPHRYVDGHHSNFKLGDLRRSFSRSSFKSIKGVIKKTLPPTKILLKILDSFSIIILKNNAFRHDRQILMQHFLVWTINN